MSRSKKTKVETPVVPPVVVYEWQDADNYSHTAPRGSRPPRRWALLKFPRERGLTSESTLGLEVTLVSTTDLEGGNVEVKWWAQARPASFGTHGTVIVTAAQLDEYRSCDYRATWRTTNALIQSLQLAAEHALDQHLMHQYAGYREAIALVRR